MEYLIAGLAVVGLITWLLVRRRAQAEKRDPLPEPARGGESGRKPEYGNRRAAPAAPPARSGRQGSRSVAEPPRLRGGRALFKELAGRDDGVVVDVETTGTGVGDQVIEVAIIAPDGTVLAEELVMPTVPIAQAASAKHGLTKRKLNGKPYWSAVHHRVAAALQGKLAVAYNAEFDARLLHQTAEAHGGTLPNCEWACAMLAYAAEIGEPDKRRPGEYRWWKLEEALAGEQISVQASHRARADAEATRQLILKLGGAASSP